MDCKLEGHNAIVFRKPAIPHTGWSVKHFEF